MLKPPPLLERSEEEYELKENEKPRMPEMARSRPVAFSSIFYI